MLQPAGLTARRRPSPRRVRWQEPILAAAGYLAIAVSFLAPVIGSLADGVLTEPGSPAGDQLQVLWNAWWVKQSLFVGASPYFSQAVFHPSGAPLVFHFLTPLESAAIAGLASSMPVALAYNLVVIAAFPVAGLGAFALCRHATGRPLASFVGGLVFMLSPFLVSKSGAGWINMIYAGLLPLFAVCLLRAVEPVEGAGRSRVVLLTVCTTLVILTDPILIVLAANFGVLAFGWHVWTTRDLRGTVRHYLRALWPSAAAAAPYGVLVVYYVAAYGLAANLGHGLRSIPEPLSYVLPFNRTSIFSRLAGSLDLSEVSRLDLTRTDTACYLGLLVAPLAMAGFIAGRRNPTVRLAAACFAVFFVLSVGPKLLWFREIVHLGPLEVRLPFALWQEVPGLGAVKQSGRYLVLAYMAMSVGVACLVAWVHAHLDRRAGQVAAGLVAASVCADFGFVLDVTALPPRPALSDHGVVLDPRLRSGLPMYYQTLHERPLVGGYLSRRPDFALRRYREMPGLSCLFFDDLSAHCDRTEIVSSLASLGVTDVCLDPGDHRGPMLEALGFRRRYADAWTVVWAVPSSVP